MRLVLAIAVFLELFVCDAKAQQHAPFEDLRNAMQGRLKSEEIERRGPIVDCSASSPPELQELTLRGTTLTQYIYNSVYRWSVAPVAGGMCIILHLPELKGLTKEDAIVLLSAHETQFEVPSLTNTSVPAIPETRRILPDDAFSIPAPSAPTKEKH